MNLKDIRQAITRQMDYQPKTSTEFQVRINEQINRALRRMATNYPGVYFDDVRTLQVGPDHAPASKTADVLQVADSPYVLRATLLTTDPDALAWQEDRSWDGRTLFLYDPDTKRWHSRVAREVWEEANIRYVSLDHPWTGKTTEIQYRFRTHMVTLPEDMVRIKSLTINRQHREAPLRGVGQQEAEYATFLSYPTQLSVGIPSKYIRQAATRMQAPAFVPTTAEVDPSTWVGPEPEGTFEYCFTISVGENEPSTQRNPVSAAATTVTPGRYDPYVESPPSEATSVTASNGKHIRVNLPNLELSEGFGVGTLRAGRSGYRKRIYRRRVTDASGTLNFQSRWYLIAEVDGATTTWDDDGSMVPDTRRELGDNSVLEHLALYPTPNESYTVRLRATFRPKELIDETDTPPLDEEAVEALILLGLALAYEAAGNPSAATAKMVEYENYLDNIKRNKSDGRPASQLGRRRPARAKGYRNYRWGHFYPGGEQS